MDDFIDPFEPTRPAANSKFARCKVCGNVCRDDELFLNPKTDEWCCRDYPKCPGRDTDIEWLPPDSDESR